MVCLLWCQWPIPSVPYCLCPRYRKPTDYKRKKLQLMTKKPLYLHLHQTLHKDSWGRTCYMPGTAWCYHLLSYTPTSASSTVHNPANLWCEALTQQVSNTYLNHDWFAFPTALLNVHFRFLFTQTNSDTIESSSAMEIQAFIFFGF